MELYVYFPPYMSSGFGQRQYFLVRGFVCISLNGKNSTVESFGNNRKVLLLSLRKNSTPIIGLLRYSKKKVKQSRYRPGVAQRVPGS